MKLEDIGFYTLEDKRALLASENSPLWRCELLITSKCNFACPYCRGTDSSADITFEQAKNIVDKWSQNDLRNIRFSGGEPTVVPWLSDLVSFTKKEIKNIKHIAISTNGSAKTELYETLLSNGVNDFSISLDACCSEVGDKMSGGKKGSWEKVVNNIKFLSKRTYVTVGVVLTDETINTVSDIISFASNELGVSDIRIITAAQFNKSFDELKIDSNILKKHPILNYRINNISKGKDVRGIKESDNNKCPLVLDDMAVKGTNHYPCIIKMREGCSPIGSMLDPIEKIRKDRLYYYNIKNNYQDNICKKNCLDVCVDYNNKYKG